MKPTKKFNSELLLTGLLLLALALFALFAGLLRQESGALPTAGLLAIIGSGLLWLAAECPQSRQELLEQRMANQREAWAIEQRGRRYQRARQVRQQP